MEIIMKKIFEIVSYKLNNSNDEKSFLSASAKMQEFLPGISGFIGRKVLKNNANEFCDLVMWESMESAKNALQVIMKHEVCTTTFAYIDEKSINMQHYDILSSSNKNLDFASTMVEIGTTKIDENALIDDVVKSGESVLENYLKKQDNFVAQFIIGDDNGFGEVVFSDGSITDAEKICSGYFENDDCLKYISYFDEKETTLNYWKII
jgi:hypothetical protein